MSKLRLGIIGCGFWSHYQTAGWNELNDKVEIVGMCDQQIEKAQKQANIFGVAYFCDSLSQLLSETSPDIIDIITTEETHAPLVKLAADNGCAVISQKPMAPTYQLAKEMVEYCTERDISFFVHENFRWQTPIRKLKSLVTSGTIGSPFKCNIKFCSRFPVFDNQPNLADLDRFILTDIGTHILDISRFLLGEADSLYAQITRVNPKIKGEDVANVFTVHSGVHCYSEMSYATIWEREAFPQTLILIEGERGSLSLEKDFIIRHTDQNQTVTYSAPPPIYSWALEDYAVAHASIVDCNRNILQQLLGQGSAETTGKDNLKTLQLVFDSYISAAENRAILYTH